MYCLVDHSSDYVMVFFITAACALALAAVIGVCVLYCHRESKQHLHATDNPKLSTYEVNDSKPSEQVDHFLLGPMKTAPPDYKLPGYDCSSGEDQGSQKDSQPSRNGSPVVKNFNVHDIGARGMDGQSRLVNPRMLKKKFFNCCQ